MEKQTTVTVELNLDTTPKIQLRPMVPASNQPTQNPNQNRKYPYLALCLWLISHSFKWHSY